MPPTRPPRLSLNPLLPLGRAARSAPMSSSTVTLWQQWMACLRQKTAAVSARPVTLRPAAASARSLISAAKPAAATTRTSRTKARAWCCSRGSVSTPGPVHLATKGTAVAPVCAMPPPRQVLRSCGLHDGLVAEAGMRGCCMFISRQPHQMKHEPALALYPCRPAALPAALYLHHQPAALADGKRRQCAV